jgi:signal transduction histidine kinase
MKKLALCIGINDYPGTGSDLSGCINDANDWSNILKQKGFTVKKLLNKDATGKNILDGMKELIEQEIINNIIKHAEANTIHLAAKKENSKLVIKLRDNGKGFDTEQNSGGVGLQNLQNRSKMINADLSIASEPGKGTAITISIKTDNNE